MSPAAPGSGAEEDADAGLKMAARGAGAAPGWAALGLRLGLALLCAGPAAARVHHLTLRVRPVPPEGSGRGPGAGGEPPGLVPGPAPRPLRAAAAPPAEGGPGLGGG